MTRRRFVRPLLLALALVAAGCHASPDAARWERYEGPPLRVQLDVAPTGDDGPDALVERLLLRELRRAEGVSLARDDDTPTSDPTSDDAPPPDVWVELDQAITWGYLVPDEPAEARSREYVGYRLTLRLLVDGDPAPRALHKVERARVQGAALVLRPATGGATPREAPDEPDAVLLREAAREAVRDAWPALLERFATIAATAAEARAR